MNNQEGKLSPPNQNRRFLKFVSCAMSTVKCDSQVAFKSHLTGTKHLTNLKQFHSHHTLHGEAGLPNFNAPSEHGQMGLLVAYPWTSLTHQLQQQCWWSCTSFQVVKLPLENKLCCKTQNAYVGTEPENIKKPTDKIVLFFRSHQGNYRDILCMEDTLIILFE